MISPPVPGHDVTVVSGGGHYDDLPAFFYDTPHGKTMYTRWSLSLRERIRVAWTGEMGLFQVVHGDTVQAQLMDTRRPWAQAGIFHGAKLWARAFWPKWLGGAL